MTQKILYCLLTILLSTETSWCTLPGRITFPLKQTTYTIITDNWENREEDVEKIKDNLTKTNIYILDPKSKSKTLTDEEAKLFYNWIDTDISRALLNLMYAKQLSILDYVRFINTLAGFGQDMDIIKAAYDIAVAFFGQIDIQYPEKRLNMQIRQSINKIIAEKIDSNALKIFYKACSEQETELLNDVLKENENRFKKSEAKQKENIAKDNQKKIRDLLKANKMKRMKK